MIEHTHAGAGYLGNKHLYQLIMQGKVSLGGHKTVKIYGRLDCPSGKRMKMKNRVFFRDQREAEISGYRPCGNCLPEKYKAWREERKKS